MTIDCQKWLYIGNNQALSIFNGIIICLGIKVSNLDYVDDIVALATNPTTGQVIPNKIAYFSQLLGMTINTVKVN